MATEPSSVERGFERILFASRWLMAPIYLGLAASLIALLWVFVSDLADLAVKLPNLDTDDMILAALGLIDLSLAGNLILIVIFSGYENFVSKLDIDKHQDRPEWQGTVDFTNLKLKLIASMVAISGIHLLKVFMDIDKYTDKHIFWLVVVHVVFVASGVILALMDWLTAQTKDTRKGS